MTPASIRHAFHQKHKVPATARPITRCVRNVSSDTRTAVERNFQPSTRRSARAAILLLFNIRTDIIMDENQGAQLGGRPPSAKPWKGLGSGVWELVEKRLKQLLAERGLGRRNG